MEFEAEIKEVKQLKTVSLDNVYSVRLITDNPDIMDLGKLSPESTVVVVIKPINVGSYAETVERTTKRA